MYYKPKYILSFCLIFFICAKGQSESLTPPNEPKNNSFYVCYKTYKVHHSVAAPFTLFRKYQYLGCMISRQPCYMIGAKNKPYPVVHPNNKCYPQKCCPQGGLRKFGWFNNYPDALNAFYRCAYI